MSDWARLARQVAGRCSKKFDFKTLSLQRPLLIFLRTADGLPSLKLFPFKMLRRSLSGELPKILIIRCFMSEYKCGIGIVDVIKSLID